MAAIRTMTGIPDTFGGMAMKLMDSKGLLPIWCSGWCIYRSINQKFRTNTAWCWRKIYYKGLKYQKYLSISPSLLQMGLIKNASLMWSGMYGSTIPLNCQLVNISISRKKRNAISSQKKEDRTSYKTCYTDKSRTSCSSISFWRYWHTSTIDGTICRHRSNYISW